MKKVVYFLIFVIFIFFINVLFYFISDDYKFFLKKIKNNDEIIYLDKKEINDDYVDISIEEKVGGNKLKEKGDSKLEGDILSGASIVKLDKKDPETKVVLGKNYKDILELFSSYDLKKIEINSNLFDVTDEYPDYYYEYYSKDLTLYFFVSKTYSEIYDIFNLLQEEQPFVVKELNNFGTNSFYINLKDDIDDNFVRIVVNDNGIVFGLKIKKDEYNNVRQKLLDFNNK